MITEIGRVSQLVRYPVKSMAGIATESAFLGWHGLDGDRRFAFRRIEDESGFPWLSASRLPELILYHPVGVDSTSAEPLPTHVRTPAGAELELRSLQLQTEIAERLGSGVELMQHRNGIFDDAPVSVISLATIAGIGGKAEMDLDPRRFRANIVLETRDQDVFLEVAWLGGTLLFGDSGIKPAVKVTSHDVRCMMINLDPDTAVQDGRVLKTVVRANDKNAGVYGVVVQTGTVRVGDRVRLA
jgi:uncharacterized protein YcbX